MKLFIAAIILLSLLFLGIGVNTYYVTRTIDDYYSKVSELADPSESLQGQYVTLCSLWESWQEDVKLLSLTINHADLMTVEEKLHATLGAARADAHEDYAIAHQQLLYALYHLGEMGKMSLGNVF